MKNFLAQFKTLLSPMQIVMFETAFIFPMADKMVPSYGGGKWASVKMGDVWGLELPVKPDATGRVTIETPFGNSVTTDPKTASAIFTFLIVSWQFERVYERLNEAQFRKFEAIKYAIAEFVNDKKNGFNTSDFFNLTD